MGNGGATFTGSVVLDATLPTASLSFTTSTQSNQDTLLFSGTANDSNLQDYALTIKDTTTDTVALTPFAGNLSVINGNFGGISEFSLQNGTYLAELTVVDRAGNTNTSQTASFTINHPDLDTRPPEITVTSPVTDADAGILSGIISVQISAFDEGGMSLIQILIDGIDVAQINNSSFLDYTLDLATIADGLHTFDVVAIDTSGNQFDFTELLFLSSQFAEDVRAPTFTLSLPDTTATLTTPVNLEAVANDNDVLEIMIIRVDGVVVASNAISGSSSSGTLSHGLDETIFSEGIHTVTVQATDVSGNTAENVLVIPTVNDTDTPTISMQTSVDNAAGPYKGDIDINVTASDDTDIRQLLIYLDNQLLDSITAPIPDKQSKIYNLKSKILASNLLDGLHTITAKAVDPASNITSAQPITFTSNNPIANFSVSPTTIQPGLPTGSLVTLTATLQQDTPWTISFTGPSVLPDITGTSRFINQSFDVAGIIDGDYIVKLTVSDVDEKPSETLSVDLITGPPIAEIANIAKDALIRDGLFDLKGTADDPDSNDAVSYKVSLFKPDNTFVRNITPQPLNAQGYHDNRVPATGDLGTLDFTLVQNGVYDLVLSVRGGNDIRSTEVRFCLESQLKVGQFSFSQQDLLIPVAGQPLAVIRTYNSLNPDSGDFGQSWTWSIADVEMELDEDRDRVENLDGEIFSQRFGGGRNVTLTLPDGRRTTFMFTLKRESNFIHRAIWTPPPGVRASLKPTVSSELVTLFFGLQYWQAAGPDTPWEYYDFPGFILTMQDGSEYLIDREDEGFHFVLDDFGDSYSVQTFGEGTLSQIKQPAGDRVEFNGDRIDHFNATNAKTKSVVFDRDPQNRITAVYDPNNLDANDTPIGPAAYTYAYDGSNNLEKVNRLIDDSVPGSPEYETTTFIYGIPQFPHYISEIQDPRGITPMRNEYDENGRLIGVVDGFGHRIKLNHGLADRTETIYDREGNPTLHAYDTRGNVLNTTDSQGSTTTRTYDADDNETSITNALGNTTSFTYDAEGNRTSVTDPLGNETSFTYDNRGNQLTVTDPLGNITTNQYDSNGNLIATVNALGQRTANNYDGNGNLTGTTDALGNTTATFGYDGSGNLTGTTDAFGFTRTFGYDGNGNQTGTSFNWVNPDDANDIRSVTTQSIYDSASQVVRTVDPEGNESQTLYNEIGKPVQTTDKLGNTTVTTYDARGNVIESAFPDGTITRTVYDKNGRAVVTIDRFDPTSNTPVNGSRTIYDSAGRVIRSERLADVEIIIETDANNQPTSRFVFADSLISSTESIYDAAGRVLESINADGESTRFEYDAAGRQTTVIDALGNRTEFEYDAAGRQVLVRDTLGRETQFEYDALGRRVKTLFPLITDNGSLNTVSTVYNSLGQRIAETDQSGHTRQFEYDILGRLIAVIMPEIPDPENNGELVEPRYDYDYDVYGRLSTIRDPKGRETNFTYDQLGRQLTRSLPLGQSECQSYNTLGQLQYKADFKGQITEFTYDGLGRISEKRLYNNVSQTNNCSLITANSFVPPGAPDETITFTYDSFGRQSQMIESRGTTTFSYDPDGRLFSIASPEGTVFYEYDSVTGRKTRTFTANSDTLYDYDTLGRLSSVTVLKQNGIVLTEPQITTYDYNDIGSRSAINYPNNTRTEYTYDSLNRLTNLTNLQLLAAPEPPGEGGNPNPQTLSSYSYTLAPNGRRTGVTETRLEADDTYSSTGITYTYDALNRLTQEASGSDLPEANFTTAYTYDLVGNRLAKATSNAVIPGCDPDPCISTYNYTYNQNDQLLQDAFSSVGGGGVSPAIESSATAYSYDPNGSLISKVLTPDTGNLTPETHFYTYNLENRLSSAEISRTEDNNELDISTSYLYNQSGIRVKADSSVTNNTNTAVFENNRTFLLDSNNHTGYSQVLEEYNPLSTGTPTVSYTIGSDVISQSSSDNSSLLTDYLLYDGHGSTRLLTDSSGSVTDRYSYSAYGIMLGGNPSSLVPATTSNLFSGETFDIDLQQQYLRARYYDQNVGRFDRLDPFEGATFEPESLHKYTYAYNDPINGLDPSGKTTLVSLTASIATVSSLIAGFLSGIANVFGGAIQNGGLSDVPRGTRFMIGFVAGFLSTFGAIALSAIPGGQALGPFWLGFVAGGLQSVLIRIMTFANSEDLQNSFTEDELPGIVIGILLEAFVAGLTANTVTNIFPSLSQVGFKPNLFASRVIVKVSQNSRTNALSLGLFEFGLNTTRSILTDGLVGVIGTDFYTAIFTLFSPVDVKKLLNIPKP